LITYPHLDSKCMWNPISLIQASFLKTHLWEERISLPALTTLPPFTWWMARAKMEAVRPLPQLATTGSFTLIPAEENTWLSSSGLLSCLPSLRTEGKGTQQEPVCAQQFCRWWIEDKEKRRVRSTEIFLRSMPCSCRYLQGEIWVCRLICSLATCLNAQSPALFALISLATPCWCLGKLCWYHRVL